jgi:hypothetical protein
MRDCGSKRDAMSGKEIELSVFAPETITSKW